jgi:hypothetical protein
MIHVITAKVMGKQETIQLTADLLLLGQGGMKPCGGLPKHFKQDVPYRHHVDAEGVAEGSILFQECDGFCRLAWKGDMVFEDRCTSNRLGIQEWIICQRVVIFIQRDEFLTGYIGKLNA